MVSSWLVLLFFEVAFFEEAQPMGAFTAADNTIITWLPSMTSFNQFSHQTPSPPDQPAYINRSGIMRRMADLWILPPMANWEKLSGWRYELIYMYNHEHQFRPQTSWLSYEQLCGYGTIKSGTVYVSESVGTESRGGRGGWICQLVANVCQLLTKTKERESMDFWGSKTWSPR
jgi:hypothetical protein